MASTDSTAAQRSGARVLGDLLALPDVPAIGWWLDPWGVLRGNASSQSEIVAWADRLDVAPTTDEDFDSRGNRYVGMATVVDGVRVTMYCCVEHREPAEVHQAPLNLAGNTHPGQRSECQIPGCAA